jgi:hypothetical protein
VGASRQHHQTDAGAKAGNQPLYLERPPVKAAPVCAPHDDTPMALAPQRFQHEEVVDGLLAVLHAVLNSVWNGK